MRMIGLLKNDDLDEHQRKLIAEKRAQYEGKAAATDEEAKGDFPDGAQLCGKCNTKAMIQMDGCMTCLNCGDSKCG